MSEPVKRTWYIEARVGSKNYRGQYVRFIDDRRTTDGGYDNVPAEEAYATLQARLAEVERERDEQFNRANEWRNQTEVQRLRAEQAEAALTEARRHVTHVRGHLEILLGDLHWCSGSYDFGVSGVAHVGWLKVEQNIEEARAYLARTALA